MKKIIIAIYLIAISSIAQAQSPPQSIQIPLNSPAQTPVQTKTLFSIEYAPNSKKQDVPLKNIKLSAKIYYYGNPMGIEEMTVDQDQHISLNKYQNKSKIVLEVLSLSDQEKYDSVCRGSNKLGTKNVLITCKYHKKSQG